MFRPLLVSGWLAAGSLLVAGCGGSTPPPAAAQPTAAAKPRPLPPGVGPKRPGGSKAALASLESAKKKARDGDLAGAAADAETAIAQAPDEAEPYLLLASVRGLQEDAAGARAALDKGLAAVPRSMPLHHASGMFLLETGDVAGAVRELEQAKALLGVERNVEVTADLAYAYLFAQRLADAEKLASEARSIDARAYAPAFTHGEALFRLGKFKEAAEAYRTAADISPDEAIARERLAWALLKQDDFAGAVPVLEKLVAAHGEEPRLRAALAQALLETKRAKEAVPHAEKALALAPDQAQFRELLAASQEAAGDKAAAKKTRAGGAGGKKK